MTSNPRRAAFEILSRIEREHSFADILIGRELSTGPLQGPDRRLLTELVYGVLRRRGTLDHIIDTFSKQRCERLEHHVLILLRLGLYQLFFLNRIPASAAVNETVNLAKTEAPRAAGFINAVLRNADRRRDAIVYPEASADPVGYLALRYSHPRWIVEQWLQQLGFQEAEKLAIVMAEHAPLTIRANSLKTSRDSLLALIRQNVEAEPTKWSEDGIRILSHTAVADLPGFAEGLFTVQDESSQLASLFVAPNPGERLLDVCAAPGGKASHLAQLMRNSGSVVATDADRRKLRFIQDTAARLGIEVIETRQLDASVAISAEFQGNQFDRLLVDAPCTGLGVIRRNPEGKWWKIFQDVQRLAELQSTILHNVAPLLSPKGTLVYSTCSTSTNENERVINDFLSHHSEFVIEDLGSLFPEKKELFTPEGFFRSWPHRHGMDGFFAARLRKIKS